MDNLELKDIFTVAGIIINLFVLFIVAPIKRGIRKLFNRVELVEIEVKSTDHALAHSLKNGYSNAKKHRKDELMKDKEYLEK